MDWLLVPLNYEFIRLALIAGLLIGILCPIVGSFLIVQRMAMLGDVVAHAVLPGLAIAHFLEINLLLGAFTFGTLSTFLIAWIPSQTRVKADTAMALTFASFFALGITLLTRFKSSLDLEDLLFGNILSITRADIGEIIGIAIVILLGIKLFYKELLFFTFDRQGAEAMGLPVKVLNLGLMAGITLTIIASMKAVGVILVIALMVGPAATAYLFVKELHWMMLLGAALGAIASTLGLYLSYYLNLPSGPAIALTVFAGFTLALGWTCYQSGLPPGKVAPPRSRPNGNQP
ncbi:metal ABC transporter permease [Trichothermofontia sp.]